MMNKLKMRLTAVLKHQGGKGKVSKEDVQAVMADPVIRNVVIGNIQNQKVREDGAKRRTKSTCSEASDSEKLVNFTTLLMYVGNTIASKRRG